MMIGMVVFYSCSSSQNITVKGTPGTEIYSPANTKLGVIDSAGELKVSVPNGGRFYHYLLSGKVGEGKLVPFALNYVIKVFKYLRTISLSFKHIVG